MREGLLVAGKYKLLKLVGTGGMGSVWLSRNEMTEREFAIKFLHPSVATNPKVLTRFLQEAKVSGRLRHPSILEIFDVGTAPEMDNAPFLVMELLEGAPLDLAIRLLGTLPLRLTLQIVLAITKALALAHDKGVVHRDLKPANIFLHRAPSGGLLPKLLDFGISKLTRDVNAMDSSIGLTQTGAVLGSPLYMSPEQAAGDKNVDGRSDIHAIGVLMWWCLLGKSPFNSTTYNTLVVEIITGERPSLKDALPDVPDGVAHIVTRCFARKREDRFGKATEVADLIEKEMALLGPGPSLESREWVEEIFAKLRITQPSSQSQQVAEPKEASTTGAVSVSVDDAIPQSALGPSPAAYTMESASLSGPYSPTQTSAIPPPSAMSIGDKMPGRSVGRTIGFAAVGLVVLAGVVFGGLAALRSSNQAPAAASQASSVAPILSAHEPEAPAAATATAGQAKIEPPPAVEVDAGAAPPPATTHATLPKSHGTLPKFPPQLPKTQPKTQPKPPPSVTEY